MSILVFNKILSGYFVGNISNADEVLKVAFVYVGPVGDGGWTYAHDQARIKMNTNTDIENNASFFVIFAPCQLSPVKYKNPIKIVAFDRATKKETPYTPNISEICKICNVLNCE